MWVPRVDKNSVRFVVVALVQLVEGCLGVDLEGNLSSMSSWGVRGRRLARGCQHQSRFEIVNGWGFDTVGVPSDPHIHLCVASGLHSEHRSIPVLAC
jgi:hypothetical protein